MSVDTNKNFLGYVVVLICFLVFLLSFIYRRIHSDRDDAHDYEEGAHPPGTGKDFSEEELPVKSLRHEVMKEHK